MGKFCFLMLIVGALAAYFGWEIRSQNTMFVGVLLSLSGGAGVDRMLRSF
jgi:hypothetical protein